MSHFDQRLFKILIYEIFFLIALGGGVRAMNAGLACPDWPLCFGQFIPDYHPEVYFEFIHRALAGMVGIVSTYLNIKIIRSSQYTKGLKILAAMTTVLLISQVIMGGLTVLLLLHDKVVTTHLALGTSFYAMTLWLYLSTCAKPDVRAFGQAQLFQTWTWVALLSVFAQIILGGLVASNYAATACPDFPLCHGQWAPAWSGPVGMQVIHRFGAYTLTIILFSYFFFIWKKAHSPELWRWVRWLAPVITLQVIVGISNVLWAAPPLITVLHLALGTLLLGICTRALWVTYQK